LKKWPFVVGGGVVIVAIAAACNSAPESATTPPNNIHSSTTVAEAPAAKKQDLSNVAIGTVVNLDGLEVSATAPKSVKPAYTDPQYCTTVSYVNGTGDTQSFNTFDWTLRDSEGVIVTPSFVGDNTIGSGSLAANGKKSGDVCFEKGQGQPAAVIYDGGLFGEQVTWNVG
jgi:hypothetical protein